MNRFKLDVNLDDEQEAQDFVNQYGTTKGRSLANLLGFAGVNSQFAANALSGYAWNKVAATKCRREGKIAIALQYEAICDRIYTNNITPLVECW